VVVAMSSYQRPRVPPFADELDPGVVQLHSSRYRNPSLLRDGGVLVVGAGNSGAEIALEVATSHPTWLSGKESGEVDNEPGLYFVGLHFLYAMSSGFLPGVGRDAEYVVESIASRH
jgi:hypothetical protein